MNSRSSINKLYQSCTLNLFSSQNELSSLTKQVCIRRIGRCFGKRTISAMKSRWYKINKKSQKDYSTTLTNNFQIRKTYSTDVIFRFSETGKFVKISLKTWFHSFCNRCTFPEWRGGASIKSNRSANWATSTAHVYAVGNAFTNWVDYFLIFLVNGKIFVGPNYHYICYETFLWSRKCRLGYGKTFATIK